MIPAPASPLPSALPWGAQRCWCWPASTPRTLSALSRNVKPFGKQQKQMYVAGISLTHAHSLLRPSESNYINNAPYHIIFTQATITGACAMLFDDNCCDIKDKYFIVPKGGKGIILLYVIQLSANLDLSSLLRSHVRHPERAQPAVHLRHCCQHKRWCWELHCDAW